MIEVIPSILTNNTQELVDLLRQSEDKVDRVHVDIIDGQYSKNKTILPEAILNVETNLKIDFHLMVKNPTNWIEKCVRAGADRVIGHIEMMESQEEFVKKAQDLGVSVGLALDLDTKVEELDANILSDVDVVLVMSVPAGHGGQEFDERAIDKIKWLDEVRVRDDTPFKICDDGGVVFEVTEKVHKAGADEVAIGRKLFVGDMEDNIEKYKRAAHLIRN